MFSKFFIHRPVFASVISIIIVLAGAISLKILPVEEYPQLTPPQIVVSTSYPGADAQTIADTVAAPLEDAINGVEDMIYMQSTSSSSGMMTLDVYFKTGTDPQTAMINVSNRVKSAESMLPQEVIRSGVKTGERSSSFLEVITFFDPEGKMDIIDLNNYININVTNEIKRLPGVGDASIVGEKDYSMRIWINPELLNRYNLTVTDVMAAVREQNSQYSAGKIGEEPLLKDNPYVYAIKTGGRLKTVKEFENIIIKTDADGATLKLKDVAKVQLSSSNNLFEGRVNGHDMVPMLIFMQNRANALETVELVNSKLEELSKKFPGTLSYSVPYDTTKFVKVSIKEVLKTFGEAIFLVFIVMYLFLGNLRSTIIPMIAIPVSIIGAFIGIYAMGFSINLITLFALILAIGIVVDDAIIVVENVERILEEEPNLTVKQATRKAMDEIISPVISIVLVLSAVFIPVSFMDGFVGIIQRQFALTLVVSVCISGFVALTLTPALCAVMLKRSHEKKFLLVRWFNKIFDISAQIFAKGVSVVLRHIAISLITVGILCFGVYELFKVVPSGLVPNEDKGSLMNIVQLPPASTLNRTREAMSELSKPLSGDKNIKNLTVLMGYDMIAGSLRENAGIMFIGLDDWENRKDSNSSSFAIASQYNKILSSNRDAISFIVNPPPIMGLSMTGGFELFAQNTTGKTYEEIEKDMQNIVSKANSRGDLMLVRSTLDTRFPQYDLSINTDKIKMLNVSVADIFATINSLIGQYYINDFNMLGKTFKVYMRAQSEFRDSVEDFRDLFVRSKTGEMIPLNSLVTLKKTISADIVDRFNGFPAAKIMGEPAPGYTSAQAINAISEVFQTEFPNEYTIGWSGSAYQEVESTGKGATAFVFGLVFVYLILAAQYERWLMPAAVMTAVPFSVFGALLFTWLRGLSNDIYFQIGLILLIGLGAKNAILIVEFAMAERAEGKSIFDAAVNAARLRFRPIIMTSIAFALGILPMVLSTGAGSASRHSLGTGVIGGMIAASTIAIFFVPLFFYLFESLNSRFGKKNEPKGQNLEVSKKGSSSV